MESIDRLKKYVEANTDKTVALTTYPEQYGVRCTTVINDLIDAIEREVEEGYIEGPTDKNGDPITYNTKIDQWGALEYIACEMHPDGTYEWFVRGHDTSAPLLKASEVEAMYSWNRRAQ